MPEFSIYLINTKTTLYNRFGWFIILGNAAFFLYLAIFAADKKLQFTSAALLAVLLIIFLLQQKFKVRTKNLGMHPYFLLLTVAWFGANVYWMAAAMFVFDLLHSVAVQKLIVRFYQEDIEYPSFPLKRISWAELNNVLLKDGLLTIDFKNDKLIQQPVDESKTSVNEAEFNEFCKQQLKA